MKVDVQSCKYAHEQMPRTVPESGQYLGECVTLVMLVRSVSGGVMEARRLVVVRATPMLSVGSYITSKLSTARVHNTVACINT